MKWYSTIVYAIGIAFCAALLIYPKAGHSTWKPEYAQNSPEVNHAEAQWVLRAIGWRSDIKNQNGIYHAPLLGTPSTAGLSQMPALSSSFRA